MDIVSCVRSLTVVVLTACSLSYISSILYSYSICFVLKFEHQYVTATAEKFHPSRISLKRIKNITRFVQHSMGDNDEFDPINGLKNLLV